jgi:hypothetical protein
MRALTPVLLAAAALLLLFHSQAHAGYTHYFTCHNIKKSHPLANQRAA